MRGLILGVGRKHYSKEKVYINRCSGCLQEREKAFCEDCRWVDVIGGGWEILLVD
jgi:hypothetical protein